MCPSSPHGPPSLSQLNESTRIGPHRPGKNHVVHVGLLTDQIQTCPVGTGWGKLSRETATFVVTDPSSSPPPPFPWNCGGSSETSSPSCKLSGCPTGAPRLCCQADLELPTTTGSPHLKVAPNTRSHATFSAGEGGEQDWSPSPWEGVM